MSNKDRAAYNEYMRDYMLRRYHSRMCAARETLGDKCSSCGSTENLELDHIDPNSKWATVAQIWSYSEKRFQEELTKCQLLCSACHQAKTLEDLGRKSARAQHGTLSSYRYCKCAPCRAAKATYNRNYKKRRSRQ